MKNPHSPVATPPSSPGPPADTEGVRPRDAGQDAFEQNPLSQVSERLSMQATEGLDDAARVREALRIVIAEGISVADAARRCHVAPSCLAKWRAKYLSLLNGEHHSGSRGDSPVEATLIIEPAGEPGVFKKQLHRMLPES